MEHPSKFKRVNLIVSSEDYIILRQQAGRLGLTIPEVLHGFVEPGMDDLRDQYTRGELEDFRPVKEEVAS